MTVRDLPRGGRSDDAGAKMTHGPLGGEREAVAAMSTAGRASVGDGKVPYGPGFHIPPPGYRTWSSTSARLDVRTTEGERLDSVEDHARLTGSTSFGKSTKKVRRHHRRDDSRKRCDTGQLSLRGTLLLWTLLSILLTVSQLSLLAGYHPDKSTVAIGLIWAAVYLELYAALVSAIGLMVAMLASPARKTPVESAFKAAKKSITSSLLSALPNVCAVAVCLGAALQLASAALYALLSVQSSITYSVTTALATSLLITLITFGRTLHLDGHLNFPSLPPRGNRNPPSQLPLTDPRPPSPSSSASSHGGQYVPDYGLDSDSGSAGSDTGRRRPQADWTDRVLERVVRSPLLDMPSLHA